MIYLYSTLALPVWHEASAQTVAYKIGFQPTRQAVFARRPNQPIGQQHEGAIGVGRSFLRARQELVEELPQAELVEEAHTTSTGPQVDASTTSMASGSSPSGVGVPSRTC